MDNIEGLDKILEKLSKLSESIQEDTLTDAGMIVEVAAKENCPVQSGALRRSIETTIEKDTNGYKAIVGTNLEYAPYLEYGTGLFSSKGVGRNTPWSYQDDKGNWHTTIGQKPQPFLNPALTKNRDKIKNVISKKIEEVIKK